MTDNQRNNLKPDLSRWDYEHPILLRPEYQGLQVTGNLDIETAEKILRRQVGLIRKCLPTKFELIEKVLNFQPSKTEQRASTDNINIYKPTLHENFYLWFKTGFVKGFKSLKERAKYRPRINGKIPKIKIGIRTGISINTKYPIERKVLGIDTKINKSHLNQYPDNLEFFVTIDLQDHYLLTSSDINLDIPFPNELILK